MFREAPDPASNHRQALGRQQRNLHLRECTIATHTATCSDDAVVRKPGNPDGAHEVSHGAGSRRLARHGGYIAVRRHAPRWDRPQRANHQELE
jgi:hypothetical protein